MLRMRKLLEELIAKHSNRTVEQVEKDIERDKILTAPEAVEYGLVDRVITRPAQGDRRPAPTRSSAPVMEASDGLRRGTVEATNVPVTWPVRERERPPRGTHRRRR